MVRVDLDRGPLLELQGSRSLGRPDLEQLRGRQDPAAARLATCDPLELPELLEWVDPHVRVRADAERDRAVENLGDAQEAVAEIGLGRRAGADARSGGSEQVELVVVRMRGVDDGRPLAEATRVGEELDRAAAVLLEALLDLAWLLVGVDVEWQPLLECVGADLLEPRAGAGADGVGGDPDGDSRGAERLDLLEVGPTLGWRMRSRPPRS